MNNSFRSLAIVPARGGSKRFPRKNVAILYGKPLIHYTLEAVAKSGCFQKIILSSDDDEILNVGGQIAGVTPEKRSTSLAGDTVKVIDLVYSIAQRKEIRDNYDIIGLFLPTCPFRTATHIQEGLKLLSPNDYSVASVTEMRDPVQLSLTVNQDFVMNPEAILKPSPLVTGDTRSQDFEKIYCANGGFYIAWLDKFIEKENFFQGQVKAYVMDSLHSVDCDYEIDLKWAEFLLDNEYIKI